MFLENTANSSEQFGSIEVICGSMFSGKTEELIRRLKRDITERGRDVEEILNRYEKTLKPMHNQFIEPTMKYADMIVPVGGENKVAIDILVSMIKEKIGK